jgi:serine/threonine protein kinase
VSGDPSDKKTRIGTGAPAGTSPGRSAHGTAGDDATVNLRPGASPGGSAPVIVPQAPPADPLIGQVLVGRYLIHKKLGEGGMGAVYYAQHTVLEKAVALKVLHGEFARKPDLVERFMQEAKAASRIRHENVIDISDFGATPDGLVFFAMELLSGHDLHEDIARHRLGHVRIPWARSRAIFLQICSALAAAHGQGVVHRDLKPENIYLVEWLGHKDFVKLLDFGIAKLTEVSDSDRKLTRTGMLFGTPEYMSPEQARGERVDHRVDIYAMGCILYQLVTGHVPFEAENFMGILSQHLTEAPPPIPPHVLDEIGAPPGLAGIIGRALEKDRERRFQTIDDLANAIRALDGEAPRPVIPPQLARATPAPVTGAQAVQAQATGARQKTQWTGSLSVPLEDEPAVKPRSKAPWIALVGIAAAGGAVAAVLATGGGDTPAAVTDAAAVAPVTVTGADPAAPSGPVPARVTLTFDSTPAGAEIFDNGTKEVVGTTPFEFEVPGGRDPRRYTFRLAGHAAKMIELVPVENVAYEVELTRIGGGAPAPEPVVETVPQKAVPAARPTRPKVPTPTAPEPGPATRPDEDRPALKPEVRTDPKPDPKPEIKPDAKPETRPEPAKPDDTDELGIKPFPPPASP